MCFMQKNEKILMCEFARAVAKFPTGRLSWQKCTVFSSGGGKPETEVWPGLSL